MNENGINIKSSEKSIQEHLRRYYTELHSTKEIPISILFDTYSRLRPSLHKLVDQPQIDVAALSYCVPRLPKCIFRVKKIIITQSLDQLKVLGLDVGDWELVSAVARRRTNYFDKITQTLVSIITSDSDIDDMVNCLISFQIERQKLAKLSPNDLNQVLNSENFKLLGISNEDWQTLKRKFGDSWKDDLNLFSQFIDIIVQSTLNDPNTYNVAASNWWQKVTTGSMVFDLMHSPIYFVSSNLHSFTNIVGGYVNFKQDQIISHIEKNHPSLYSDWLQIKNGQNELRVIDFLYYISSRYFSDLPREDDAKTAFEQSLAIRTIRPKLDISCNAQTIPVSSIIKSNYRDPNLKISNPIALQNSRAQIINIDYPLGMTAYYLLSDLLNRADNLKGIYIIGKAAILSGEVGDIQIPKIVFDERTNNIFHPSNIFNEHFPHTTFQSSILKDQKSISVYGTYLENEIQLQNYISSGFNIIEMESGPYLSAIHQKQNGLDKLPVDTVSHLNDLPFDLGIINYASDNPLTHNLGKSNLSLKGIEPTYLAALSVVQRIIDLESV